MAPRSGDGGHFVTGPPHGAPPTTTESYDRCRAALPDCVREVASGLGFVGASTVRLADDAPPLFGASVSLSGEQDRFELYVLGASGALEGTARTLLMLSELEDLPRADVEDAVCEFANILAGSLKSKADCPHLKLGLPTFGANENVAAAVPHCRFEASIGELTLFVALRSSTPD